MDISPPRSMRIHKHQPAARLMPASGQRRNMRLWRAALMAGTPINPADFSEMDEARISAHHWKIMFISGMGCFTDAYDLFIIGVVMTLIKPLWHVGPLEESLVESTALLASALGALLFGRVADMVGRKRIYGLEVLVLAAGAIACAFAPGILWLIGLRFILGIGI